MDSSALNIVDATWEIIRRLARWTLFLAIIFFLCYVLYCIRSIVASVFLAVILTYIMLPGVEWLCKKRSTRMSPKTHRLIATILVFLVFLAMITALISIFVVPFSNEMDEFIKFINQFGKYMGRFAALLNQISSAFQTNVNVKDFIGKPDLSKYGNLLVEVGRWLLQFAGSSVRIVLELILIPVLAFYFVFDYRSITREMYGLISRDKRREAIRIGRIAGEILQSYIFGQLILCVIAGVLTGLFLSLLDVKYVVVLALFAGITRAIPIIGPVVSGIPIILIGALSSPGRIDIPLYLFLFVVVMHFSESKFIMPQLIGQRLRLHPAVVIIVLLIGAEFFGLAGMFLAAPIAAVIRDLMRRYYIKPRERRTAAAISNN